MNVALTNDLPDLTVLVSRDGTLLGHVGGTTVRALALPLESDGRPLDEVWPPDLAQLIKQLTRRATAVRGMVEGSVTLGALRYEVRANPQGPERAICVIRRGAADVAAGRSPSRPASRRGFLARLRDSMSTAALHERSLAVACILIDGLSNIEQVFDEFVRDAVLAAAIRRLPQPADESSSGLPIAHIGHLGEDVLAVVLDTGRRELIEASLERLCASLREPIEYGDALFQLKPHAGVALFADDSAAPESLVEQARAAAAEARHGESNGVMFFSNALALRSMQRLDIARELHEAIAKHEIRLRYRPRHDLVTGRLVAMVGYMHWPHPLRGDIRPVDFLAVAESTGLSSALSRSVLQTMHEDLAALNPTLDPSVRLSFGALRHHLFEDHFLDDLQAFLGAGTVAAGRFEVRVGERSYVTRKPGFWRSIDRLGVRLIVDEVGRAVTSVGLLARARGSISGMQLDRAWVIALDRDAAVRDACGAMIGLARALGLTAIATGVDHTEARDVLIEYGCQQGLGDLYPLARAADDAAPDRIDKTDRRRRRRPP